MAHRAREDFTTVNGSTDRGVSFSRYFWKTFEKLWRKPSDKLERRVSFELYKQP